MPFLNTLTRLLRGSAQLDPQDREKLLEAWNLYDKRTPETPSYPEEVPLAARPGQEYDQSIWTKKLRRILDDLPESRKEWAGLMAEVAPLGLDTERVAVAQKEEFTMLVRRAVADGRISPDEHARLDLARQLIGLSDPDSDAIVQNVKADAEEFFGRAIVDTSSSAT